MICLVSLGPTRHKRGFCLNWIQDNWLSNKYSESRYLCSHALFGQLSSSIIVDSHECTKVISTVRGGLHTRLRSVTITIKELSLVEKAETLQIHFTLEGEGVQVQRKVHG